MKIGKYSTEKSFDHENGFLLTSDPIRIQKWATHYNLYCKITNLPGDIVECGVYKGGSLIRFLTYRDMLENPLSRKIVGFDAFGEFPVSESYSENDINFVDQFSKAGGDGIEITQLEKSLRFKGFVNYELIKGDVKMTINEYLSAHTALKISLLHLDMDVYEPTSYSINLLWERLVPGGLVLIDDYATVEGATRAVDEFLSNHKCKIYKPSTAHVPAYIIKE
jgi:hypothetical protein